MDKVAADMRKAFLILSNGRTGSTWLLTSLGLLPGVAADFEIKTSLASDHPVHRVVGRDGNSIREILENAFPDAPIIGSKLTLEPELPTKDDVDRLVEMMGGGMNLVHLKRSYWRQVLSARARMYINVLNDADDARVGPDNYMHRSIIGHTNKYGGNEEEAIKIPNMTVQNVMVYITKIAMCDLSLIEVCRRYGRSMVVDYSEIAEKFLEVARFVGCDCSEGEIRKAVEKPVTKKLPPIDDDILPNPSFLKQVCRSLDDDIARIIRENIPVGSVWKPDGKVEFSHLKADISGGGLQWQP